MKIQVGVKAPCRSLKKRTNGELKFQFGVLSFVRFGPCAALQIQRSNMKNPKFRFEIVLIQNKMLQNLCRINVYRISL